MGGQAGGYRLPPRRSLVAAFRTWGFETNSTNGIRAQFAFVLLVGPRSVGRGHPCSKCEPEWPPEYGRRPIHVSLERHGAVVLTCVLYCFALVRHAVLPPHSIKSTMIHTDQYQWRPIHLSEKSCLIYLL